MELQKGKPADTTGREEKEIRVYDLLDKLGIEFYRTDHEEANTMEKCNEIDRIFGHDNLQEFVSLQPSKNGFLYAYDARRQAV